MTTSLPESQGRIRIGAVHDAFRIKLADALRPLADALEIQSVAARLLGKHLGAMRAFYVAATADNEHIDVESDYTTGTSVVGRHRMDDFGTYLKEAFRAGRTLAVSDGLNDPRVGVVEQAGYKAFGFRAFVAVPLVKEGRFVAAFGVQDELPRDWTTDDVALIEETAERTWAALERARAEEALRRSREELAAQVSALTRLHGASTRLWRSEDLRSGLEEILDAAISLLGADMGNVQLLNPKTRKLEIEAHRGFQPEFFKVFREVSMEHDCACGRSLRAGHRIIVEDVAEDPSFAPFHAAAAAAGYRAIQSTPLFGWNGEPLGMLSTHFRVPHRPSEQDLRRLDLYVRQAVDFIERRRIAEALRDSEQRARRLLAVATSARAEAESANRAKDEFLATLSHELRTPVAAILLWTEVLRSGAVPLAQFSRAIESIAQCAHSQSRLIEDLLDLSRLASGKFVLSVAATDVGAVVREAVDMVTPTMASKKLTFDVQIDGPLGIAALDGGRLKQILGNLLANAAKFTPKGGSVTFRVRKTDKDLEVEVADTGEGIALDLIPNLFERFWQGDMGETRQHMGLGIGLALTKQLVALHRGTIEGHSDGPGRGAVFRFCIPWRAVTENETPAEKTAGIPSTSSGPLANVVVLLVEDDANTREAMQWTLARAGATVVPVTTASEALAAIEREGNVDVVVSDLGLPGASGHALIEWIGDKYRKTGRPPPPSCAVSAHARDVDRQRALAAGFDMYLAKPLTGAQLVEAVTDLRGGLRTEATRK